MELNLIPRPRSVAFGEGVAADMVTKSVEGALPAEGYRLEATKNGIVLTAGSERYPGGLLLGTVESSGLDETGVSRYASVSTDLSLDGLEQVFIITEHDADDGQ